MRVFLLGKARSITHWLEDFADALRADGHEVSVGVTRNPRLSPSIEAVLLSPLIGRPMVGALERAIRRFSPDLIVAIGAYHVPASILQAIAEMPHRAPLVGWVGDIFSEQARSSAAWFDAVAYTDTALVALHRRLGFAPRAIYLPHAVNPHAKAPSVGRARTPRMVLIANPTPHRRAVVASLTAPIVLHGPAWTPFPGVAHEIHRRRVARTELPDLYAGHLAALNIRNELNVLDGLNQRNFEPCLWATPVVAEHQADLAGAFEPGREVLAYRTAEELDEIYGRLRTSPAEAAAIGARARNRVLADHTYGRRLETLRTLL